MNQRFIFLIFSFFLFSCAIQMKRAKNLEAEKSKKSEREVSPNKEISKDSALSPKDQGIEEKMYPYLSESSLLGEKSSLSKEEKAKEGKKEGRQLKKGDQKKEILKAEANSSEKAKKEAFLEERRRIEKKKKAFEVVLESLDEKKEILFLPLIHYEKEQLKKQVSLIYKGAIKELKRVHPFIVLKDVSLIEEVLSKKEMNQEKKDRLSQPNSLKPSKRKIPNSFSKAEKENNAEKEQLSELSDYTNSVPSYLRQFFDSEREEYRLHSISSLLDNGKVSALVEGKILHYDIEPLKETVGFYSFVKLQGVCELRLRLVSVMSGRVIWENKKTVTVLGKTRNLLEFSREKLLKKHSGLSKRAFWEVLSKIFPPFVNAVKKLSWNGRVAYVSEDRVYINAGRASGIEIGDFMQVKKEGIEIFDPETGNFIGQSPGEIKGILKVIQHFGKDGSIAVIDKGDFSKIQANDRVQIF